MAALGSARAVRVGAVGRCPWPHPRPAAAPSPALQHPGRPGCGLAVLVLPSPREQGPVLSPPGPGPAPCGGGAAAAQRLVLPRLGGVACGAPWPGACHSVAARSCARPGPQPLADTDPGLLLRAPAHGSGDGRGVNPPQACRLAAAGPGRSVPLCLASAPSVRLLGKLS